MDPAAIKSLVEAFDQAKLELHSFMLLRHGDVVAEGWWTPYQAQTPHLFYSLTKSFCSTAVGFAVSEGLIGLEDSIVDHFADLVPEAPDPNLAEVTVRDLLTMSVGHDVEPDLGVATGTWESCVRRFLAHPLPHEPGSFFLYNTAASNVLSILVQRTAGESLDRYLEPRLMEPLGVRDKRWTRGADFTWGGSGLYATTETIAKFGQLYLNNGIWQGKQLLPAGWVEMATRKQVSNGPDPESDWNQGYGFQFWRCRHDAYRGDGAFGQFCIVLPKWDAVVAITCGEPDMQAVLNAIWTQLLPGFDRPTSSVGPCPDLQLAPRGASAPGPGSLKLSEPERGFELDLANGKGVLSWNEKIPFTLDAWTETMYGFGHGDPACASVRAQWLSPSVLQVKITNLETPNHIIFTVELEGDGAGVTIEERGHFSAIPETRFNANSDPVPI